MCLQTRAFLNAHIVLTYHRSLCLTWHLCWVKRRNMELYTHTDTNTGCIYTSIHLYLTLSLSLSHTHKRNLISFEFLDRIEGKGIYWQKDIQSCTWYKVLVVRFVSSKTRILMNKRPTRNSSQDNYFIHWDQHF